MNAWSEALIGLSSPPLLLLKLSVFLAAAWGVHALLQRANPRWRVLLWRCVMAGLVLLPLAQWQGPVLELAIATIPKPPEIMAQTVTAPMPVGMEYVVSPPPLQPAPEVVPIESRPQGQWLLPALLTVWVVLAASRLMLIARAWYCAQRISAQTLPAAREIEELTRSCAAAVRVRCSVAVRITELDSPPFLHGVLRPVIVLPHQMAAPSFATELPGVLVHELAHVLHRDLLWLHLSRVLHAVLWFHPLVWRLSASHEAACEAVCDGIAAAHLGDAERYSQTLAQAALDFRVRPNMLAASAPMLRSPRVLKRIKQIQRGLRVTALKRRWVIVAAGLLVACATLLASVRLTLAVGEAVPDERDAQYPKLQEETFEIVTIHVVDEAGEPLDNAGIIAFGLLSIADDSGIYPWDQEEYGSRFLAKTSPQGDASVPYPMRTQDGRYVGKLAFFVNHPGYIVKFVHFDLIAPGTISLQRAAQLSIRGVIADGSPVPIRVLLGGNSEVPDDFWESGREAAFEQRTSQLAPGEHMALAMHIDANGQAFFSEFHPFSATADTPTELQLLLSPGVRVEGQVSDEVPRPVENGRVDYIVYPDADIIKPDDREDRPLWSGSAEFSRDGLFSIDALPQGTLELLGICPGFLSSPGDLEKAREDRWNPQQHMLPTPGTTYSVRMDMIPTASIAVSVHDTSGAPVHGAKVSSWPNVRWHKSGTRILGDHFLSALDRLAGKPEFVAKSIDHPFRASTDEHGIALLTGLPPLRREAVHVAHENLELPLDDASPGAGVTVGISGSRAVRIVDVAPAETTSLQVVLRPKGKTTTRPELVYASEKASSPPAEATLTGSNPDTLSGSAKDVLPTLESARRFQVETRIYVLAPDIPPFEGAHSFTAGPLDIGKYTVSTSDGELLWDGAKAPPEPNVQILAVAKWVARSDVQIPIGPGLPGFGKLDFKLTVSETQNAGEARVQVTEPGGKAEVWVARPGDPAATPEYEDWTNAVVKLGDWTVVGMPSSGERSKLFFFRVSEPEVATKLGDPAPGGPFGDSSKDQFDVEAQFYSLGPEVRNSVNMLDGKPWKMSDQWGMNFLSDEPMKVGEVTLSESEGKILWNGKETPNHPGIELLSAPRLQVISSTQTILDLGATLSGAETDDAGTAGDGKEAKKRVLKLSVQKTKEEGEARVWLLAPSPLSPSSGRVSVNGVPMPPGSDVWMNVIVHLGDWIVLSLPLDGQTPLLFIFRVNNPGEDRPDAPQIPADTEENSAVANPSEAVPPEAQAALDRFHARYRLDPGEVLRHIPVPFMPEREVYYRVEQERKGSPMDYLLVRWKNGFDSFTQGCGYVEGQRLDEFILSLTGLPRPSIQGPEELLSMKLTGDWIVQDEADPSAILDGLLTIASRDFGIHASYERKRVRTTMIIMRGKLKVPPTDSEKGLPIIHIGDAAEKEVGEKGPVIAEKFGRALEDFLGMPLLDHSEKPEEKQLFLKQHAPARKVQQARGTTPESQKLAEQILKGLAEQTGLRFNIETREHEVWEIAAAVAE